MRDGWTETTLGDVAEVLDRMRKPISSAEREKRMGDVPYYGATGLAGWIDKPIFDEELVLLGEDAIDFLNPDVHKAYLISGPSWVNNHAHVLRAKREKVVSFFLMEALNAVDYSQFVAFGTRSKLTQGAMMGISVQIPPLREQKRIVDVVSSVDAYIDALQQQADTARTARNAVLHELLSAGGDDWTDTTLGDVASLKNGDRGKNYPSANQRTTEGVPFINAGHLLNGKVDMTSMDYISEDTFNALSAGKVEQDDILYCLRGTVGKFGMVEGITQGAIASSLVIVRTNQATIPKFIYLFLDSESAKKQLEETRNGAVQPNLSAANLASFRFLLPPLVEQKRIVEIVSSMDEVIESTEQAVADAKNLRSGLLSDLLSGEHEIPESYDAFVGQRE
jgi:type I restriction enzyme S subunit